MYYNKFAIRISSRSLKKNKIKFKPTNTLHQLLVKLKDPVSKENVVGPVYKIKCDEWDGVYVGERERSLKARFSEHRRPSSTTSEVSKHIHVDHPQHSVELENTKVLTTEMV